MYRLPEDGDVLLKHLGVNIELHSNTSLSN